MECVIFVFGVDLIVAIEDLVVEESHLRRFFEELRKYWEKTFNNFNVLPSSSESNRVPMAFPNAPREDSPDTLRMSCLPYHALGDIVP